MLVRDCSRRQCHREFAMGSREMSEAEFTSFLQTIFGRLAEHTIDGSIPSDLHGLAGTRVYAALRLAA